jgi:hypothetical protein
MKISENTINILKNFSTINPSILIRPGNVLKTVAISRNIHANATVEEEFPSTVGIYELPKFLGVLSLFQEPEINFGEHQMNIISGRQSVNYTYADISSIVAPPEDKKIVVNPVDIEFSISQSELQKLVRAAGVLQLPHISVVGDGSAIKITATNSKNPTSDIFSVEVGSTDKVFNMFFKVDNIIKLLPINYDVKINSRGISSFTGNNVEYFITTEADSKFNS